jgi:hypothetical protein
MIKSGLRMISPAVSQILLAEAYRYGNVVLLSLITYLGPLINLMADLISRLVFIVRRCRLKIISV